jgi:hypothetical protein
MPSLSRLDNGRSGRSGSPGLALFLTLAFAAPTLFAQELNLINAGDKEHDRVGLIGEFKKKSLVGSWQETVTFAPDQNGNVKVLNALVSFHEDGTEMSSGQAGVTTDPSPTTVTSDGVGSWRQTDWHTFIYTELRVFSDFSGTLTGFLQVRGTYTLVSENEYKGKSYFEVFAPDFKTVEASGFVTNKGNRIPVIPPPAP